MRHARGQGIVDAGNIKIEYAVAVGVTDSRGNGDLTFSITAGTVNDEGKKELKAALAAVSDSEMSSDVKNTISKMFDGMAIFVGQGEASISIKENTSETSVYKGYKRDKIEMRGDRAEISDFPLYLNTVAGGLDRRDQTIGGFSFVVKIYAVPVIEIIG